MLTTLNALSAGLQSRFHGRLRRPLQRPAGAGLAGRACEARLPAPRAHCAHFVRSVRGLWPSGLNAPTPSAFGRWPRSARRGAGSRAPLGARGSAPQKYRPAGAGLWSGESAQARRTPERGAPFGFRPDQYFRLPPPPRPLARRGCGLDALAPRISLRDIRGSRWAIRRGPSCRGRSI